MASARNFSKRAANGARETRSSRIAHARAKSQVRVGFPDSVPFAGLRRACAGAFAYDPASNLTPKYIALTRGADHLFQFAMAVYDATHAMHAPAVFEDRMEWLLRRLQ